MARIISIINEKGGSGKTTTAVSLGAYLTKFGRKVLICDLDPQGNATISLGFSPKKATLNLYHSLSGEIPLRGIIKNTSLFNLDLAPASADLAGSNIELLEQEEREKVLRKILSPVVNNYDFILLDPPPSLGILTLNALFASKEVIIPIQCEYFALRSLEQLFEIFELLKQNLNKDFSDVFALLTMYDIRNNLSHEVVKKVRENFPGKVFETIIPRSVRLAEAPKFGKTIFQYAPESKAAKAYERLAEEVITLKK
ncbi:AAA family ATPase [bacterium]|nr:AAA family ATPase [bacterium]